VARRLVSCSCAPDRATSSRTRKLCAHKSKTSATKLGGTFPLTLVCKRLARDREFPLFGGVNLRVAEVEIFHRFYNGRGNDEPGEPSVIGRHNEPWRVLRRSRPNSFLERVLIIAPESPFVDGCRRKLPVLLRLLEALHETLLLLLAREM